MCSSRALSLRAWPASWGQKYQERRRRSCPPRPRPPRLMRRCTTRPSMTSRARTSRRSSTISWRAPLRRPGRPCRRTPCPDKHSDLRVPSSLFLQRDGAMMRPCHCALSPCQCVRVIYRYHMIQNSGPHVMQLCTHSQWLRSLCDLCIVLPAWHGPGRHACAAPNI